MSKYYSKIVIFFILPMLFMGCKKFIETDVPSNQLISELVYRNDGTATSALSTVYAKLFAEQASPYVICYLTGLQSDELSNPAIQDAEQYYTNTIDPLDNLYCTTYWLKTYNYIYQVNAVIEGCTRSETLTPFIKTQLISEALFTRAYLYFHLVNLYGDVPLALTTNYEVNKTLFRTSESAVYNRIVQDLKAAEQGLSADYVGQNSLPGTIERIRPNKSTATALLACVYLYTGKWAEAEQLASSLIEKSTVYQLEPTNKVFLKNSRETIWALRPPYPNITNVNTVDGSEFVLLNSPISSGKPYLNPLLVNAFEEGDLRKINWTKRYIDSDNTRPEIYHFTYKYKVMNDSEIKEHTVIFRLAEQYLIRAEARAHQGKYTGALDDINIIRVRAGLPQYVVGRTVLDINNMMKLILKERQVELFTEQGHRWMDLKRAENCDSMMNRIAASKKSHWYPNMRLWPIPSSEISNNPNLQQSPGYK